MPEPSLTSLIVRDSSYRGYNNNNRRYDVPIGKGLFANRDFVANEVICFFKGIVIDGEAADRLIVRNRAIYIVSIDDFYYLDCRKTRNEMRCYASYANH